MPFQAIPGCVQVAIRAQLNSETCVNTIGFMGLGGDQIAASKVQECAEMTAAIWQANMLPILPLTYVMTEVHARGMTEEADFEYTDASVFGETGEESSVVLPNNVSWAVSFRTGLTGRSNRGRNFWPGFVESQVTGQEVLPVVANAILAAYSVFLDAGEIPAGLRWAVLSRKPYTEGGGGHGIPITSVVAVDLVVDSMRRRLPKRGV